jgi:hypothetical protein
MLLWGSSILKYVELFLIGIINYNNGRDNIKNRGDLEGLFYKCEGMFGVSQTKRL